MTGSSRAREALKSVGTFLGITLATLAGLEIVLRVADFRELRETLSETSLVYDFDAELGWMPIPGSAGTIQSFRTTHYKHNSLGLRDEEPRLDGKPAILFLGDSFVWGLDSEADERFSDLLKARIPDHRIYSAGVSGFGTDQEYLLLERIWPTMKPAVVVLIFCAQNDREDNMRSLYYFNYYKPYFVTQPDGSLQLMGQPVPRSHLLYFRDHWLVHHLWLARLATNAYMRFRYPKVTVPDPSEKLIGKMRAFVEGNGGKLMVGIQWHDERLERYLAANKIPFVSLDGADFIKPSKENVWGPHWTPEGQKDVADRIFGMLSANKIVGAKGLEGK
ncbi:MAG: SGNH/GDSL hydrolase family protein [Bradyrhizobium sp.]